MAITDPRDISGLVAWFSAEAETGYSDGAAMTQWTDLSGNGNHAVAASGYAPIWRATGSSGSGPVVDFLASLYFDLPDNLMNSHSAGTMAANLRPANASSGAWNISSAGNIAHFVYSGWIYDNFGSIYQHTISSAATLTWHRYQSRSSSSDFKAWLNGSNVYTNTGNTVGWPTTTYYLGQSNSSWPFNGRLTSFVIYSRALSDAEIADLDAWMVANPSGGTAGASNPSGALAATLPTPTVALAGTYADPAISGALAGTLPVPTVALAGSYDGPLPPPSGVLAATLPVPTVDLAGGYSGPGADATGALAATLPVPTLVLTGKSYARNGYGLVLDSETTVDAVAPLPATPSDSGTPALTLHVVTPTVPTPVLVNGRPS